MTTLTANYTDWIWGYCTTYETSTCCNPPRHSFTGDRKKFYRSSV